MFTTLGYKGNEEFDVKAYISHYGIPVVLYKAVSTTNYKEGTPIDFLESGISCPEVHDYFASYVNEQGYNDE